jgi:hypothetical protein
MLSSMWDQSLLQIKVLSSVLSWPEQVETKNFLTQKRKQQQRSTGVACIRPYAHQGRFVDVRVGLDTCHPYAPVGAVVDFQKAGT